MRRVRSSRIALGLVLLGVAVAVAATRLSFLQGTPPTGSVRHDPAPGFVGIDGWLNSPPLTVAALHGHVVLVDFWTYSCVNCIRTLPALRALYDRYHPVGFQIVGIHSPEFSFEKNAANVRAAIHENGVSWPVALDNEMATWNAYDNHYWPHVYLIDAQGTIRFDHIGEGGDDIIEAHLRSLLTEAHATLPAPVNVTQPLQNPHITPEIYAGYDRGAANGALGNPEGYAPNKVVDYRAVDSQTIASAGTGGLFFLQGRWRASAEYMEAAADGARLELPFYARDLFFVASAPSGAAVHLLVDGKPVAASALGADARGGVVHVSRSDLYKLLTFADAGVHRLTIVAEKGFRLYTFTFGG